MAGGTFAGREPRPTMRRGRWEKVESAATACPGSREPSTRPGGDRFQKREQPLQKCYWRWRTSSNVQIDGKDRGDAADARVAPRKDAAIPRAIAHGDHPFRV